LANIHGKAQLTVNGFKRDNSCVAWKVLKNKTQTNYENN